MKRRTNVISPVDTINTLSEMLIGSDFTVEDGEAVYVRSNQKWYIYRINSGLVVDGVDVIQPAYGNGVWQLLNIGPASGPSGLNEVRYVAKSGSDTTGDGSFFNPYATVQKAVTSITDAASTKIYEVFVFPGDYSASTFTIKPWIYVVGSGIGLTTLAPVAAQALNAAWAGAVDGQSGIYNASIATNLVADLAAIGNTSLNVTLRFDGLEFGATNVLFKGNTANHLFEFANSRWPNFVGSGHTLTITDTAETDMMNIYGGFAVLNINGTDAFFTSVTGQGCGGFAGGTFAWTGAVVANALDIVFSQQPFTTGGVPIVTGLGAIYNAPDGFRAFSLIADSDIQFNPLIAGGAGGAGALIGCDAGTTEIQFNVGVDIAITLRKPANGTRVIFKNQSSSKVGNLTYVPAVSGPSYIPPLAYVEMFFQSGTWEVEEPVQYGTGTLTNGVTAALIPADITATTAVVPVRTNKNASTALGFLCVLDADKSVGTFSGGGGFLVRALDAGGNAVGGDQSSFRWIASPNRS